MHSQLFKTYFSNRNNNNSRVSKSEEIFIYKTKLYKIIVYAPVICKHRLKVIYLFFKREKGTI